MGPMCPRDTPSKGTDVRVKARFPVSAASSCVFPYVTAQWVGVMARV